MKKMPKTFTVTLGGKTLRFEHLEEEDPMTGYLSRFYYLKDDAEDIDLGFAYRYTNKALIEIQIYCHNGHKRTWCNTHFHTWADEFLECPSIESAIFTFKEFLKQKYISKRASAKKKEKMPFGL